MKVAIHQPNYLPYLGFFDKMNKSDIFVIYDDAQFNKGDFQHRNRIRIFNGWKWLTVPVEKKMIPINEIKIRNDLLTKGNKWNDAHLSLIEENYSAAPEFINYGTAIKKIFSSDFEYLFDLNISFIEFLIESFHINTKIVFSSELGFKTRSTEKLVDIVDCLNGDIYISGPSGKNYLDESLFNAKSISVEYQDFKHPAYTQCYGGFEPNMSSIDALFNIGDKTFETR
ncbi:WbqC family protein [uncultured Methanolobus sp.]|uniref:WbqC family protein n=1 Tax=uncultured Methanolobus sp. TaxID=218300 RepID=UPI002AAAB450|nr:WbqC family protein [uncultured Methanolobus sp.]